MIIYRFKEPSSQEINEFLNFNHIFWIFTAPGTFDLNSRMEEWLSDNSIEYSLYYSIQYEKNANAWYPLGAKILVDKLIIDFRNISDEILFKLTWT